MAQNNDKDATGTYSAAAKAPENTGTYSAESQETFSYSELREKEFKSRMHGLGEGDKLRLCEQDFTISEIISQGTGEAVIYKIQDEHHNTFALKLYFEFSNPKEEPNEETLKRVKEISDPDILKLHDFGVGMNKYQGKYCFEISDYAEGGDLFLVDDFKAKYTPQFIEKIIIPETFKGIKKFHSYKIYHCDLKPGNIFYLDQDQTNIVIGDYGSAKAYDLEAEQDLRKSSTVKGTEAYLAPEQARGIVSQKNDYYSFGIILLHLLYPESISNASNLCQIDKNRFERIVERQHNSQPVVDFNPNYARLNQLIEGLTLSYHVNRWGQTEVEKWLDGEDVEVKYKAFGTSSIQPIKLGYKTIRTEKEFVEVLEKGPAGYEDLIGDPDTYSTVKSWLDSCRDIPTRKVFDGVVRYYQPFGKAYVKEALLRFFEPERPINIDMHSFNIYTSDNPKKEIESFIAKLDEIWKIISVETGETVEKLKFYLFQLEFSLRQRQSAEKDKALTSALIEKLFSAFGLAQKSFDNFAAEIPTRINENDTTEMFRQLLNLFYSFDPNRVFQDKSNKPIKTLEDLGLFYVKNETVFSDKFLIREKERYLKTIGKESLLNLAYKPFIFEIFKDKAESQIELIDVTFDALRNYRVSYKFYKSLKNFLSRNGVNNDFTSRSESFEVYTNRRGFLKSFESVSEHFIRSVCDKHNIRKLTPDNESQIKEQFTKQSWERYFYIKYETWTPSSSTPLDKLHERVETVGKRVHWRPAALTSMVSAIIFLIVYALLAVYAGWIVWDTNSRYITFNSPARLDGTNYNKGDALKVLSQNDFFDCLEIGSAQKCFPTQSLINQKVNQQTVPIETLGKFDYEFKNPRDVFKVTKAFWLKNNSGKKVNFESGDIVNIRIDNNTWCFNFGAKGFSCYAPDAKFHDDKGNAVGTMSDHGSAIKDYRGKNLFTFSRNVTIDGTTFTQGSSWIDATSGSPWIYCIDSNGRKCFPTKNAIDRLRQTDVPVVAKSGTFDTRKSDFNIGAAMILSLFVGGLAFAGTLPVAKKFKLFVLRGRIGTAKFNNMNTTTT